MRDGVIVAFVIFLIALISILTMYIQATNAYQVQIHKHLLDNARAAATLVDGDLHLQLDSPDKNGSELHQQMLKPLYDFLEAVRGVHYLYTMVLIDDQVYFVLDSPSPYKPDEDSASVMEPYDHADPEMFVALREGREMVAKEFYVDQMGHVYECVCADIHQRG